MKNNFKNSFKKKKILITGHTGFKGSWLTLWLSSLGAKVYGISLNIPTKPSNFETLKLHKKCTSSNLNINNLSALKKKILKIKPDYIFHLAAQALVKKSYDDPINTFQSNTVGTLNLLESLKFLKKKCTVILITSDKSYKNLELKRGYKETDILGGHDPYSASKAAAEIIIQSYIHSFFKKKNNNVSIGIARAGNVIGGGDWSHNRLIPDCVKSWSKNKKVQIRNPLSTRPWQHVLEALGAYLMFSISLRKNKKLHGEIFNFGPSKKNNNNVIQLVKKMSKCWKKVSWQISKENKNFYESNLLKLNCEKANKLLKWKTFLNFNETATITSEWYRDFYKKKIDMTKLSLKQIQDYEKNIYKHL
jgi:CDP-glucose 4,6-dehydratase